MRAGPRRRGPRGGVGESMARCQGGLDRHSQSHQVTTRVPQTVTFWLACQGLDFKGLMHLPLRFDSSPGTSGSAPVIKGSSQAGQLEAGYSNVWSCAQLCSSVGVLWPLANHCRTTLPAEPGRRGRGFCENMNLHVLGHWPNGPICLPRKRSSLKNTQQKQFFQR